MCNCIDLANQQLKMMNVNTILDIPFEINMKTGQMLPPRTMVSTTKDDLTKKRGRPYSIMSTYCPFCGEKYIVSNGHTAAEPGAGQGEEEK
jgi:hypothetical protein